MMEYKTLIEEVKKGDILFSFENIFTQFDL